MNSKNPIDTVKKIPRGISFGMMALLLGACGGSGGGSDPFGVSYTLPSVPAGAVTIDSGNSQQVAGDTLTATAGAASAGVGGVTGVAANGDAGPTVKLRLNEAVNKANQLLVMRIADSSIPAGATTSYDCGPDPSDGTITATTEGYNSRIDYNNCNLAGTVVNGAMAATNVGYTGNPPTPPYSLSVTYAYNLTFSDGVNTVAMMGRFDAAMAAHVGGTMTASISNGEMGITNGTDSVVMTNISNSQACSVWDNYYYECNGILTLTSNYTVGGTRSGGSIAISTTTPLQIDMAAGASYPYAGVISVVGDNNTALTITIFDDDIASNGSATPDIEVVFDPNNTFDGDETTMPYNWTDFFP